MAKVSVLSCSEYELNILMTTIKKSLDNIIDCDAVFTEGKRVYLKVNAVSPQNGNRAYTTNPLFLQALIRILKQYPVTIIVGDNPPYRELKQVLTGNGMLRVIEEEQVILSDNTKTITINNPTPIIYSSFEVSREMVEADILINLPKLKTHSFTYYSGAQKNLFGLIYGLAKAQWHVKASDPSLFGTMINDLYLASKNQFTSNHFIHLMDAIDVLEGEGPTTGGTKRYLGYIIASTNAISLDRIALELAGLDYTKSFITMKAAEHQIEPTALSEILIVGSRLRLPSQRLKEPEKTMSKTKIIRRQWVKNLVLELPIINHILCIKCGECTKICPLGTMKINKKGDFPKFNRNKCIRCWCCSEVCPVAAIRKGRRPLIGRIIFKLYEK